MEDIIKQENDVSFNIRERICEFEDMMRQVPGVQHGDSMPLKHSFAPGIYVREIFIPKDSVVVGKIHRHEHPNFLMSGKVKVVTEGAGIQILEAPMSIISPAGTKRVVHALEDTVWITVHATNSTNLDEIEKEVIVESFDEYDQELLDGGAKCLGQS